jgi:hypothetical protein
MAEGELGAVFEGLAGDATDAGSNIAESVAKLTEKTADTEEANLEEVLAADARANQAIRDAGQEPPLGAPGPQGSAPVEGTGPGYVQVHPDVPLWKNGDQVRGVLRIGDQETPLVSGESGPGKWFMEGDNFPGGTGSGRTRAWTHVEGHAAGTMQQGGVQQADLFINKVPCGIGPAKCRFVLNKLLPPGATLDVHFPNGAGGVSIWRFVGGQPGWQVLP